MTIAILGSGWLGYPLTETLVQRGHNVHLSTRQPDKTSQIRHIGATPFIVDIEQLADTDTEAFLTGCDTLICNITSKHVVGFQQLITLLAESTVKSVLFVSSSSVYRNTQTVVTEDQGAEDPDSVLYQIEQAFQACSAFNTSVLRFCGLIGYQRHPGRFFKAGRVVPSSDAPVNLIHRDDCIGIILEILEQQAWGEVFNGSADTHPTKREFYSHARNLLNAPHPEFDESGLNQYKIVSNAKIKQRLGYDFIHPDLMAIRFDES